MHLDINRRLPRVPLGIILTAALLAAACGRPSDRNDARVQTMEPVEVARSAPDVEFSQVTGVDVDSRGRIYAGDGLGEIIVLDEHGAPLRRMGGMGAGPGEFQSVGTVRLLSGDSLYVYDGAAQRATVYLPNSERVAYTIGLPQLGYSFAAFLEPLGDGTLIGHFRTIKGDFGGAEQSQDDVLRVLNRDGSLLRDSILTVPQPEILEIHGTAGSGFFLPLFGRQSLVRWTPDGRIFSLWTDSTQVRIHDAAGRERGGFTAMLPGSRIPLADATIDSLAQRNASARIPVRTLREAFRAQWQTWPRVEDMLVDDRARIWICPVTLAPLADWLAFDARGAQVAAFRLPSTERPRLIRGDRVYAVRRDSLDVESLVVYRLAPSPTPAPERP